MSFRPYERYRDSGVRWLGSVPIGWTVKAIKHCFSVVGGSTPKSEVEEFWDGEHVWVTPADLSGLSGFGIIDSARRITDAGLESCGTNLVPPGSIVLSTRAPIGSLAIAGTSLCTNQGCKSLVPRPGSVPRYFAYVLSIAGEELNLRGRGTTFLELSADALGAFEVVVPTETEQADIANFLDRETAKIDALVEEQKRLIELLKEKRHAVISQAVTKGMDLKVPMKDSGVEWLGQVPQHWEVLPCRAIVFEKTAKNDGATCSDYLSLMANVGVIPYAEKGDVGNKAPEDLSKCKLVAAGDIVINSMNYGIGSFGLSDLNGVCSPVYIVLRPIDEMVETRFALRIFAHRTFQTYAQSFGNGILAHRAAIGWDTLKSIGVPVPPLDEQRVILEYVDASTARFEALVVEAEAGVELLMERRSALISAAVTGKIDVRGLARQPEGATA